MVRSTQGTDVEFTVVVESYNLEEGSSPDRLRLSLRAATALLENPGRCEVLLTDVCDESSRLQELLAREFPQVRRIAATGKTYDAAKTMAAHAARGRYVLYLDGDCVPEPGWHERLLAPLRRGEAVACGGFTRYEGGLLASLCTVMDFGFLLPRSVRPLKCYASNNSGFLRETLIEVPIPNGDLRCRCFAYAQRLLRRGTPIRMVPEACVIHEMKPLLPERSRQGYDRIAACWADPELPEARWLRLGVFSLPLFYAMAVALDWWRLWIGRRELGIPLWLVPPCLALFPILRCIDAAGMLRALVKGPVAEGWGGWAGIRMPSVFSRSSSAGSPPDAATP